MKKIQIAIFVVVIILAGISIFTDSFNFTQIDEGPYHQVGVEGSDAYKHGASIIESPESIASYTYEYPSDWVVSGSDSGLYIGPEDDTEAQAVSIQKIYISEDELISRHVEYGQLHYPEQCAKGLVGNIEGLVCEANSREMFYYVTLDNGNKYEIYVPSTDPTSLDVVESLKFK